MIAVLLATYNGEKYLAEQLTSLLNQTFTEWKLYVRDDGSTDRTMEMVHDFKAKHNNKVVVVANEGSNLGAKKSFIKLLEMAEGNHYMFCDQDDVWLPNKIEVSLKTVESQERKFPKKGVLAFCDAVVTDEKLNTLSSSFWKTNKTHPFVLIKGNRLQVFNCAPGCTMIFNNILKKEAFPFPEKVSMHDWWMAIVAQRHGVIQPINESLILYRQHGSNTIGAEKISKNYFFNKLNNVSQSVKVQKKHLEFLEEIEGINKFEFYCIKIFYNLKRFFS